MRNYKKPTRHMAIAAAATLTVSMAYAGTTAQPGNTVPGNTNGNNYSTISISGSTALRNDTTSPGLTFLPNGASIFLSSGTYTASTTGAADQLAPTNSNDTGDNTGTVVDVPALRVEWHEQGSVEGILELATDQIATPEGITLSGTPLTLVTRAPTVSNPVWINRTTVSSDNSNTSLATTGTNWAYGVTGTATGQNPVQMAISDVEPVQAFSVSGTGSPSPFAKPQTVGYGKGNPVAAVATDTSGLGLAGSRQQLVDQTSVNITTSPGPWNTAALGNLQTTTVAVTATTFSANPGTGLTNLNTVDAQFLQLTGRLQNGAAFQMSTRDVNSGTRNTAATNTGIDPSWAVGLNDGGNTLVTTSATAADGQNIITDNSTTAADGTNIPNATIRFSGKTSGGVLRTTIENSRMGVGTLSLPDAISGTGSVATAYTGNTPLRALTFNGVSPTFATITTGAYTIWQQEQYVTVKNTNSTFSQTTGASYNTSQWSTATDLQTGIMGDTANTSTTQTGNFSAGSIVLPAGSRGGYVQGQILSGTGIATGTTVTGVTYNPDGTVQSVQISDHNASGNGLTYTDRGGDVANFRDNITNAVRVAGGTVGFNTITNPGDTLITNGYILPQFMMVTKKYDGQPTNPNTPYDINTNPNGYIGDAVYGQFNGSSVGNSLSAPAPTITSPNANNPSSYGYYGQAVRGKGQAGTGVVAALPVFMNNSSIAITSSNYLFGNFANTGVRDYQSFQYGLAAAKALYNSGDGVDAFDATAATGVTASGNASNAVVITNAQLDANGVSLPVGSLSSKLGSASSFLGQRGPSGAAMSYTSPNAFAAGVSKGDLIVLGDYNGDGRFDGKDIYAMAVGTALAENTSTGTLSVLADINTGVLRKNSALDFALSNTADAAYNTSSGFSVASNASGFIRQSARAILSSTVTTPAGATFLYNTSSGATTTRYFTYDPTGTNAFNKTDVNQDGVVDFNDVVQVDNSAGQSYTNVTQSLATTEQAPITGASQAANLVLVQQVDGEAAISAADVVVADSALTGSGTTNWYGYTLNKTGTGTIAWNRTGGAVNVYTGAALQISGGTVHVTSAVDPFTDNNKNLPASLVDTSSSVGVVVTSTGTLQYTGNLSSGIQVNRLSNLNISTGGLVTVDPVSNKANRSVLVTGGLTLSGGIGNWSGHIDLGNNDLVVRGGSLVNLTNQVKQGFGLGGWNNTTGITSASAASNSKHLTALGVIQNSANGFANGTALYSSTAGSLGLFDGLNPSAADVLVKYTYYGDTNLDGMVDGSDYSRIDSTYASEKSTGSPISGWFNGDFNYDGVVNGSDYTLIDNAFNTQGAILSSAIGNPTALGTAEVSGAASSAVPEPTAIGLIGLSAAGLLGRRRRF